MENTTTFLNTLVSEICCKCGIQFAVPRDFQRQRLDDLGTFFCPSGHSQHYQGPTEAQRLRDELARANRRAETDRAYLEQRIAAERSAAMGAKIRAGKAKAALTRAMARVGAGVCPCCNRTFKQLAAHMKAKHAGVAR